MDFIAVYLRQPRSDFSSLVDIATRRGEGDRYCSVFLGTWVIESCSGGCADLGVVASQDRGWTPHLLPPTMDSAPSLSRAVSGLQLPTAKGGAILIRHLPPFALDRRGG